MILLKFADTLEGIVIRVITNVHPGWLLEEAEKAAALETRAHVPPPIVSIADDQEGVLLVAVATRLTPHGYEGMGTSADDSCGCELHAYADGTLEVATHFAPYAIALEEAEYARIDALPPLGEVALREKFASRTGGGLC